MTKQQQQENNNKRAIAQAHTQTDKQQTDTHARQPSPPNRTKKKNE
jgi:hypothetical protein